MAKDNKEEYKKEYKREDKKENKKEYKKSNKSGDEKENKKDFSYKYTSYEELNKIFNDLLPILETRRSIRKYKCLPVDWKNVVKILEAGKCAPSTGNLQSARFVVITDDDKKRKIAESCVQQYWVEGAPVLIVVCNEDSMVEAFYGKSNREKYSTQNASAAIQNMLIETHSLGLSTCWVGGFEEEKIRRELEIPSDVSIHAILPIGYGDEEPEMPKQNPLYNFVYMGEYGTKVKNKSILTADYGDVIHEKIKETLQNLKTKKKRFVKQIEYIKKKTN